MAGDAKPMWNETVDLIRADRCFLERILDRPAVTFTSRRWVGDLVCILARSKAAELSVNLCPARPRMLELFEDEQTAAFGDSAAGCILIEWANGARRRVVVLLGESLEKRLANQ